VRGVEVRRFVRFSVVGMLGTAMQLVALQILTRRLGIEYVRATALAVEVSLLHNFVWHEMWTWKGLPAGDWPLRLARFQLGNGVLSLGSNTVLTYAFHEAARLPVTDANLAAVAVSALMNFGIARFWVFRTSPVAISEGQASVLVEHQGPCEAIGSACAGQADGDREDAHDAALQIGHIG
jgi:putative flippase GtrA